MCSKEHLQLALEAARDGIVLLKNTDSLLPLPKTGLSVAVIGPNANASSLVSLGNYYGRPCKLVTLLQGFEGYSKDTTYHPGCDDGPQCVSARIEEAVGGCKKGGLCGACYGVGSKSREGVT